MDIGSIFLVLALFAGVGVLVVRPILEHKSVAISQQEHEASALLADRDRLLGTLQELDFDHLMGKIPEEDYPAQRAGLLAEGIEVLRKLDSYQPQKAEAWLESALADRRAGPGGQATTRAASERVTAAGDDSLEASIAARRRARTEKSAGFCQKCGRPVQQSDRFCPRCGTTLA